VDVFGNDGGDYAGPLSGQSGVRDNFSLDPLFCDPAGDDYTLRTISPCAPPGVTGCGQVGARGAACSPIALERETWGKIKSRFC
jgi:hypothetical protein